MWKFAKILTSSQVCLADFAKPWVFHCLKWSCCEVLTRRGLISMVELLVKQDSCVDFHLSCLLASVFLE